MADEVPARHTTGGPHGADWGYAAAAAELTMRGAALGHCHDPSTAAPLGTLGALVGDFYVEDPTVRGVVLSSCDDQGGDFYFMGDPTARGLLLGGRDGGSDPRGGAAKASSSMLSVLGSGCYDMDLDGDFQADTHRSGLPCGHLAERSSYFVGDHPLFADRHKPLPVPRDPLFPLERTAINITLYWEYEPQDIMNKCLEFLRRYTRASILNADTEEFSVKVKVFTDDGSCTMKVMLYEKATDEYVLEFQRCHGDCVAFHRVYQQASEFYRAQPFRVQASYEAFAHTEGGFFTPPASPVSAAFRADGMDEADLTPLYDGEQPRAEVASALAAIARASSAAPLLGDRRALEHVRQFVEMDDLDVAYPVARLLLQLASCDEAAHWFSAEGVLPSITEKVRSKALCALMEAELTQVVDEASRRFPPLPAARAGGRAAQKTARAGDGPTCSWRHTSHWQHQHGAVGV